MSSANDIAIIEPYSKPCEIERLVSAFESCTLPREEWTHRAHLTVALWYLVHHSLADATKLIREGIQKFNRARGIVTTKTGGYHEMITLFYVRIISRYLRESGTGGSIVALANNLMKSCGDKALPLDYYSEQRLMSWEARMNWVEPDLKSLD